MAIQTISSLRFGENRYPFTLPYGVCSTAASTTAKTVTVDNFSLETGAMVMVKFTDKNSASTPTLNVNGTGAKAIRRYGTTAIGTNARDSWTAGTVIVLVYDGTAWNRTFNNDNSTYTNLSLGQGYGVCDSALGEDKVVTLSSYTLTTGGIVAIRFTGSGISAGQTLNINSKGAKPIYHKGLPIETGVVKSSDTATFIYDGSYYHLISIDRDDNNYVKQEKLADNIVVESKLLTMMPGEVENKTGKTYFYSNLGYMPSTNTLTTNISGSAAKVNNALTINGETYDGSAVKNITINPALPILTGTGYPSTTTVGEPGQVYIRTSPGETISSLITGVPTAGTPIASYYCMGSVVNNGVTEYCWSSTSKITSGSTAPSGYATEGDIYIQWTNNQRHDQPMDIWMYAGSYSTSNELPIRFTHDWRKITYNLKDDLLDEYNIIKTKYLPSYVDDVVEGVYDALDGYFYPTDGSLYDEEGKIYVDIETNKTYRWSGSTYVEISSSLALGTTSSSAAPGNHTHTVNSHSHSCNNTQPTFTGSAVDSGTNSGTAVTASSTSHTHSIPELKFTGTAVGHAHGLSGSFTSGANSGTAVTASTSSHKHSVTAAGTVGANTSGVSVASALHTHSMPQLLFTGTSASHTHSFGATTSGAPSATVKVGSETHTHTIPALTFTGSAATSDGPSSKVVAATLTSSVANQRLTLNFAAQTVAGGAHTHSVTAAGSVASSTTGAPSATTSVGSSAHTHTTAAATTGSASHTPSGTITVGSGDFIGQSGPMGALEGNTIEVATKDHAHTFTGSAVTSGAATTSSGHTASVAPSGHTHSTTLSGNTGSTNLTPTGTIATGSGTATGNTGSASTSSGHTVSAAPSGHKHSVTAAGTVASHNHTIGSSSPETGTPK